MHKLGLGGKNVVEKCGYMGHGIWLFVNILSAGFQGGYVEFLDILSAHYQIFEYSMC